LFFKILISIKFYIYIFFILTLTFFNASASSAYNAPNVIKTNSHGLKVTWSGPNNATIERWEIIKDKTKYSRPDLNTTWREWSNLSSGTRKYRLKVCINNSCEYTPWSKGVALLDQYKVPNLSVKGTTGSNTINVYWEHFGDSSTKYYLDVWKDNVIHPKVYPNLVHPEERSSVGWVNLSHGFRKYQMGVTAYGDSSPEHMKSNWSEYIYFSPTQHTIPTATIRASDIHVTWEPISLPSDFSGNVTYTVKVRVSDEKGNNSKEYPKDPQLLNSVDYNDLPPGYREYAVKSCVGTECTGFSPYSQAILVKAQPLNTSVKNTSATIFWPHIVLSTGYEIILTKDGFAYSTYPTTNNEHTFDNLPAGIYSVSYRINSTYGWSQPSSSQTFTVDSAIQIKNIELLGGAVL